jgi:alkaline phosphatase
MGRMAPANGNHEYLIPGAATYFDYFNGVGVDSGMAGHRARGYYAFDYGSWRIYILNSEQQFAEQAAWIRADALANPRQCQLAVMHKPYYSSAANPRRSKGLLRPIVEALLATRADVLLSGHVHSYERFFPQNASAVASTLAGMRQFVVGTGGGPLDVSPFAAKPQPNSERRIANTYGILYLKLFPPSAKSAGKYDFGFFSIAGTRLDAGGRPCR